MSGAQPGAGVKGIAAVLTVTERVPAGGHEVGVRAADAIRPEACDREVPAAFFPAMLTPVSPPGSGGGVGHTLKRLTGPQPQRLVGVIVKQHRVAATAAAGA